MAREYARIRISISEDEDFEELSPLAQWLYLRLMLPDPTLNHCGVLDWRPQRLVGKARGLTLADIVDAAAELEAGTYALFDLVTEEALVRSYMRNDELLRNPKMAACVIKGYRPIASKALRAAVITELRRVHADHPEFSSWTHRDTSEDLAKLLSRPSADEVPYAYAYAVTNGYPKPVVNSYPEPVTNTNTESVEITNQATGADNLSRSGADTLHLTPNTYQPAPMGGQVRTEPQEAFPAEPDLPPPPSRFCPNHPAGTDRPCLDCKRARQESDRADLAAQAAVRDVEAEARLQTAIALAQAIVECERCDDDGYIGGQVCAHRDHASAETRAAARAKVAAAISKGSES